MNIDPNKLTEKSRESLQESQDIARRLNHQQVDGIHLLSALVNQEHGAVSAILERMEITASAVQLALQRELENYRVYRVVLMHRVSMLHSPFKILLPGPRQRRIGYRMNLSALSISSSG